MPLINPADPGHAIQHFDVLATCSNDSQRFVTHVGFCATKSRLNTGSTIDAIHMAPPLSTNDAIRADLAAHVPLTNDEIQELGVWFAGVRDEYELQSITQRRGQYTIHPPILDVYDETTKQRYIGNIAAGFVLDG